LRLPPRDVEVSPGCPTDQTLRVCLVLPSNYAVTGDGKTS
jgi:hypothetical protein